MDKSAGIEIEHIPTGTTREDLVTLFEKELKDENEIKYILFPLPENRSRAFVCFKQSPDKAFIERLMAHNPLWSIAVDSRMQTYCCCTAEVDALIVATIPDIPACIAMLEKDYGIEASYDDDSGKFLLKGMMHQLQCAQVRLDDIFREQLALQKMQLLQIDKSKETSVKGLWLDDDKRRDVGSSARSTTAGRDYRMEPSKDFLNEKRSFLLEDQFEERQSRDLDRFTKESDYRSLPAVSSLYGDQDLDRMRTSVYDHEPRSYTSYDRSRFLSTFDHDRSNRADGPVSLPQFADTSKRRTEDLHRIGDYHFSVQSDKSSRIGQPSRPEYMQNSDWRHSDDRTPTYASVLNKKVDTFTSSEPLNAHWSRDRVYAAGQSGIHREYQSAYPSKSRVAPLSDLVPSRESVLHADSTSAGRRARSLSSEQPYNREEVDDNGVSRNAPAFWKEKLDFESERLYSLPSHFPEVTSRGDHPKSKTPDHSTFSRYEVSDTANRQQYLTERRSDKVRDEREDVDEPVATSTEDQESSLFLETYVVMYIMAIAKFSVQSIKHQYKVEIKVSTEPGADFSMVVFTGRYGQHPDQVEKASKKFAELYEETFNDIIQREVSVNADLPEVADVIERVQKMYRIIVVTDVAGTVTLVGEFRDVMKAVDMLNRVQSEVEAGDHERGSGEFGLRLGMRQSGAGKDTELDEMLPGRQDLEKKSVYSEAETSRLAKRSEKSPDRSAELKSSMERSLGKMKDNFDEFGDVDSLVKEPRSSAFVSMYDTNRYTMTFKDDFQVFIYTGDITKLRVDAIVNAANSFLKNYSGVAGAIEDAGGPQFKKDCEDYYLTHGPLKVSEVAHTVATGDLRCRNVIHTVGPQWYSDLDEDKCSAALVKTFENVLNYAEQTLEIESLALPAVGTGIYGVPIDLCARAIYGAVHEYLESSSSSIPTLKSVHVVNKDPGTTELIQAVFEGLRQLELDQQMKSRHSRSPSGDEGLSETSVASRKPCSERKLLKSMNGKDETPGRDQTELKNYGSFSGSDIDESEPHVVQERVGNRESKGSAETVDATSKKGFFPITDSDSDEF